VTSSGEPRPARPAAGSHSSYPRGRALDPPAERFRSSRVGAGRVRIAAGAAVLGILAFFLLRLAPRYLDNLELQRFVEQTAARAENQAHSDDLLRTWIVEKAASLDLPVKADQVQVRRLPGQMRIEVRYVVPIDLTLYQVDLHFASSAGGL